MNDFSSPFSFPPFLLPYGESLAITTMSDPDWLSSFLSDSTPSSTTPSTPVSTFSFDIPVFHPAMSPDGFSFSDSWLIRPTSPNKRSLSMRRALAPEPLPPFHTLPPLKDSVLDLLNFNFLPQTLGHTNATLCISTALSPHTFHSHDFPWHRQDPLPLPSFAPSSPDASHLEFLHLSPSPPPSSKSSNKRVRSSSTPVISISSEGSSTSSEADDKEEARKRKRRETNKKSAKAFRIRRKGKLEEMRRETELRDVEVSRLREEVESLRRERIHLHQTHFSSTRGV